MNDNHEILSQVADYYTEKLSRYGETAQGVDWNSPESQLLRFMQLSKIIHSGIHSFSINDLGCGYGALLNYLRDNYDNFEYLGIDISDKMTRAANHRHVRNKKARFITSDKPDRLADYSIASGIFNVRLSRTCAEWEAYLQATLDTLNRTSRLGFSFNCLTSYSDEDKKRDYLYYADPCQLFDLCKRRYSREVALLHDYGLYEFTILVKKTP